MSEQLLDSIDITLSTAELRPNDDKGNLEDTSKVDGQGDDAGSMESNSSHQMIIRATREWSVRYQDRGTTVLVMHCHVEIVWTSELVL